MEKDENIGQKFVKGSSITFIGMIVIGISQFVLRIFLARGLSKADFGLLFSVFALLSFINIFSHLGLNQAITRFVSKYVAIGKINQVKSSVISALGIITIASLLISATIIALSNFLASSYFHTEKAVPVLIILSVWFFFMSYHNLLNQLMRGLKDFFGKTMGQLLRNLIPLIGVLITITIFDLDVNLASFFYLLGPILSVTLLYILLRKNHSKVVIEANGKFSRVIGKKMIMFGTPLILSGLAGSIIGKVDTMMLTGLRSLEDVGLYEIARITRQALQYFGSALAIPLFPMVSELWAKNQKETLQKMLNFMTKISFMIILPVAMIFIAFPEIIIRILFGPEYLAAANAMRILAGGALFWTIESIFVSSLSGIGKTKLVLKTTGTAALFNIGANYILIPYYGATGAAIGTGMSFLIAFALSFYYSRREIEFFPSLSPIVKTGVGSVLTLLLIFIFKKFLPLSTWPLLIIVMGISTVFYGLWIFKTKIIERKDLEIIKNSAPIPSRLISFLKRLLVD